jgi:hypothetical protein
MPRNRTIDPVQPVNSRQEADHDLYRHAVA